MPCRLRPLNGRETVEGFKVAYTPGHASHHVCYLHEETSEAYVGDVAGVRIPPFEHTVAPTPPPDIDVEAWLDSLHIVASWNPKVLCMTHFGRVSDVEDQLHRLRLSLLELAQWVRELGEEEFTRNLDSQIRRATDADVAARHLQAAPAWQLWQGLGRYWRKRSEQEGAA